MVTRTNNAIQGPSDLYELMLEVKKGGIDGEPVRAFHLTKKQAGECGITWKFVEQSAELLGLKLERSGGSYGYRISK